MTAQHLARRLADAATRTGPRRAQLAAIGGPAPGRGAEGTEPDADAVFVPIRAGDVPTGWWAYGRAVWPLGDDITDDRVLVEGTDRRSYAALNHYLRQDHTGRADRARGLPRDIPTITEGWVGFERAGDTVRVTSHAQPDRASTAALVAVLIADR